MLDKNDKKYILRRIITYIAIAMIMFLISSCQVHALEFKQYSFSTNNSFVTTSAINENTWNIPNATQMSNYTGWLYFQLYSVPYIAGTTTYPVLQLQSVRLAASGGTYNCKLGNMLTYSDNTNGIIGYNVECPVVGNVSSLYVKFMGVSGNNNYGVLYSSSYGTFYDTQISIDSDSVSQLQFSAFQQQLRDDFATIVSSMQSSMNTNSAKSAVEALQVEQRQQAEQAHQDAQATQQKIDDVNDSINSEAAPTNSMDFVGYLPTGPLDTIVNLPLQFLQSIVNKLGTTCEPLTLNLPFVNETLNLPCIWAYLSNYIPGLNTILTIVGIVADIYILYHYLIYTYKWADDLLTLRENNQFGGYE